MSAMRMLFLTIALLIVIGIWLTGFDRIHWFLYLPPAALASVIGKVRELDMDTVRKEIAAARPD